VRLPRSFFARDPRVVAEALVGKYLVHGERGGRIVETEAYLGPEDKASHARFGPHGRSRLLFGPPGIIYVFVIYGMHECFNVVTGEDGKASAVLIRALEPLPGTSRCDGPGRLTKALGIDRRHNGDALHDSALTIEERGGTKPRIVTTGRIGVEYAGAWARRKLRYLDADSDALSVRFARVSRGAGTRERGRCR
jgi:DNA-3-methyladenine glycosylase